jgi:Protoglobin
LNTDAFCGHFRDSLRGTATFQIFQPEDDVKHINEQRLESDLAYRFGYLTEFMGFSPSDIETIHGAAGHLAPLVPALVDAVYDKLFSYDATKRHFVPRQSGYEGPLPESLEALSQSHEQIQFRKQHLGRYLTKLVTAPYDGKLVTYLDHVGMIHTPKAGSPELDVPLVQMNALMGFVADALIATIQGLGLDPAGERAAIRAFNKLLWLQNDLITRHYVTTKPAVEAVA